MKWKHNCLRSITQQRNVIQVCKSSNKCDNFNFYFSAGILFYLKHIGEKIRKNQTVYLMSIMQYAIFGIVDHQIKTCWKNILTIRNEMHH